MWRQWEGRGCPTFSQDALIGREPVRPRPIRDLVAGLQVELTQDVLDMHAGGAGGDDQRLGDLAVAAALADQANNFQLPRGEEPAGPAETGGRVQPKRPGEFTCQSCFLVKPPSQLADPDAMYCLDCV